MLMEPIKRWITLCAMLFGTLTCPVMLWSQAPGLISIDYKDAGLASVLKALAYSNDLNIVVTKDIKGTVSATLKDVTIDEALTAILSVNGYTFVKEGKVIYIVPGGDVNALGQKTVIERLSYLTAAEAKQLLSKVVSAQGDIQVNAATNSLVITDFAPNIANIRRVLKEVDIQPLQVLIEARILDVQAKAFENFGTTMTYNYAPKGVDPSVNGKVSAGSTLPGPSNVLSGNQWTVTTAMKNYGIDVTVDALLQEHKAHLLASPSITTINGREARIIIGEKVPVIEKTTTQTSTVESTNFVDVGTTLRVTPQVSPDGWITMNVHPEVSSVTNTTSAGPNIATREADAVVRVKDGQTIIIGGLISKQDDHIRGGVPLLRSIPIIGKLFSQKSKEQEEKELTVFITPHLIDQTRTPDTLSMAEAYGTTDMSAALREHARQLEEGIGPGANRTPMDRKILALATYQMLLRQFPQAEGLDEALFKAGCISDDLKDYTAAVNSYEELMKRYPDSRYYVQARNRSAVSRQKRIDRNKLMDQRMGIISAEGK